MCATYPYEVHSADWSSRGTRALAVKTQTLRVAATAMEWFPNNVARNFPVNLSVIEIWLLQFQRFWA